MKRRIEVNEPEGADSSRPLKKIKLGGSVSEDQVSESNIYVQNTYTTPLACLLPPEIFYQIFKSASFTSLDLTAAKAVCVTWNEYLKDEEFSWRPLLSSKVHGMMRSAKATRFQAIPYNQTMSNKKVERRYKVQLLVGDYEVGQADTLDYSPEFLQDVLTNDFYDWAFQVDKMQEWDGPRWAFTIKVEINYRRLENKIKAGEQFDDHLLTAVCIKKLNPYPVESTFQLDKHYTPEVAPIITEQPAAITGINLHPYQIKTINFMVSAEMNMDKEYEVSLLIPTGRANLFLYATDQHRFVIAESEEERAKYKMKFKARGGVLADEMGLGKTVEIIGLILSHPRTAFDANMTTLHQTKATLIISPNHLVAQWRSEIEKYCGKKLTVIQLTTIVQVKKFSGEDVMKVDVVLITYELLANSNYYHFYVGQTAPGDRQTKGVILHHFHWHRVVLDEAHEGYHVSSASRFDSTYRWYMSGTPFPSIRERQLAREYIGLAVPSFDTNKPAHMEKYLPYQSGSDHALRALLDKVLLDNLLWRNTKNSIKDECELVKTKTELKLLDLSPMERAMYEDYPSFRYSKETVCNTLCKSYAAASERALSVVFQAAKVDAVKHYGVMTQEDSWSCYSEERKESYRKVPPSMAGVEIDSLAWMIENYGTKTAHVYHYLKELFDRDATAKALIFGKTTSYLEFVRDVLEARTIYTTTIKGNVHRKSKSLKNFKNKQLIRVVLLNIDNVASGMNLIEASHVIFLETVCGEGGKAKEEQAIGRAYRQGEDKHVTVVRFICKDTMEQSEYELRYPDELRKLSLNASQ